MTELAEKGYCVIPNVMSSSECDEHIASYRKWLDQFGEHDWPFQRHSIIQSYRIGHFEPTWKARLTTKKVFEVSKIKDKFEIFHPRMCRSISLIAGIIRYQILGLQAIYDFQSHLKVKDRTQNKQLYLAKENSHGLQFLQSRI